MDNNKIHFQEISKLLNLHDTHGNFSKLKRLLPLETVSGELISAYCLVLSAVYILINSSILEQYSIHNTISIFAVLFMLGFMHVFAIVFEPPTHFLRIICLAVEFFLWMLISIKLGGLLSIIFSAIGMMVGWALLVQLVLKKQDEVERILNNGYDR